MREQREKREGRREGEEREERKKREEKKREEERRREKKREEERGRERKREEREKGGEKSERGARACVLSAAEICRLAQSSARGYHCRPRWLLGEGSRKPHVEGERTGVWSKDMWHVTYTPGNAVETVRGMTEDGELIG